MTATIWSPRGLSPRAPTAAPSLRMWRARLPAGLTCMHAPGRWGTGPAGDPYDLRRRSARPVAGPAASQAGRRPAPLSRPMADRSADHRGGPGRPAVEELEAEDHRFAAEERATRRQVEHPGCGDGFSRAGRDTAASAQCD